MTGVADYEVLVRLIEAERELVRAGRVAELAEAVARRGAYVAGLPPAPPEALPAVERARALHARLIIETTRLQTALAGRVAARRRAVAIGQRYAPAGDRVSVSA